MSGAGLGAAIQDCFDHPHSEEAFVRFDGIFRPLALAILLSVYSNEPSLAEDAYQTAFVKFLEIFRAGDKGGKNWEAYFIAIAKNCLVDELRKRSRTVSIGELLKETAQDVDEATRTELSIALFQAMMKLPRRCQFILEAYYIRSLKTEEISKRLSIQPDSFHMTLRRCRESLKKIFEAPR